MTRPDDRKPFRGKCPICGRCGPHVAEFSVATAWAVLHLDRAHHVPETVDALHDARLVVEREYVGP